MLFGSLLIASKASPARWPVVLLVAAAALLRVATLTLDAAFGPITPYDPDWTVLRAYALRTLDEGPAATFTTGRMFFGWLVGLAWHVTGFSVAVVNAINVAIGTAIVVVSYRLALAWWGSWRRAALAAAIVGAFPTLVVYSVQPSREPLVTLAVLASMALVDRWYRRRTSTALIASFLALGVAAVIHSAFALVALALVGLVTLEVLRPRLRWSRRELVANTAVLPIAALVAVAILVAGVGLDKAGNDPGRLLTLAQFERTTTVSDIENRTAYVTRDEIVVTSFADVARQYPRRLLLFLFKPFPGDVREAADAVGLLVSVFVVIALLRLLVSWRSVMSRPGARAALVTVTMAVALMAWGTVNYGTATRHKSKLVPVVAALVVAPRRPRPASERLAPPANPAVTGVSDPR